MKTSELIKKLEEALELLGDKDVYVRDECGEYELVVEVIESGYVRSSKGTVVKIVN
ncbi:MAG: hypothetical protein RSF87_12485 [Cellulosilyticaceae bacterium]